MIEHIEGIVVDIVKHNDKHNVVTLFTRRRGRMAFLVPVGKSKSGRLRNAAVAPMAAVECDVNIREGKELNTLRNLAPLHTWHGIYSNPVKSALLLFLMEFCNRLVRQYPPDERLWHYLTNSLEFLNGADTRATANFHIAFLLRLLPIAGIEPSVGKWSEDLRFDMMSGEMADPGLSGFVRRRQFLNEEESRQICLLARMNFRNLALFRFSRAERYKTLERILEYYSIHLPIGNEWKSLAVLREMFD